MTNRIKIVAAGNTLAPALSILRKLGYTVTREKSDELKYCAQNETCVFYAEDPLTLLGLVKIYEVRGSHWQPSEEEVELFLLLGTDKN